MGALSISLARTTADDPDFRKFINKMRIHIYLLDTNSIELIYLFAV